MITGIVLAAGRSSRMGAPKALLQLEGESFLERIVKALTAGGCDDLIVVTGPQDGVSDAAEIGRRARGLGARTGINPDQESGQIDSLRAALRMLPDATRLVLSTPVDAPGVTPELVRSLIEASDAPNAEIIIPTYHGRRGHPVLFKADVLPELLDETLPEGARSVIHRDPDRVVELPIDSAAILLDIDTPADYQRLLGEAQ